MIKKEASKQASWYGLGPHHRHRTFQMRDDGRGRERDPGCHQPHTGSLSDSKFLKAPQASFCRAGSESSFFSNFGVTKEGSGEPFTTPFPQLDLGMCVSSPLLVSPPPQ